MSSLVRTAPKYTLCVQLSTRPLTSPINMPLALVSPPVCCPPLHSAVPPLPFSPGRWTPPLTIVGEAQKPGPARTVARASAAAAAAAASDGTVPAAMLSKLVAATAEEQVSRHESPVRCLRWHSSSSGAPSKAMFASVSTSLMCWAGLS